MSSAPTSVLEAQIETLLLGLDITLPEEGGLNALVPVQMGAKARFDAALALVLNQAFGVAAVTHPLWNRGNTAARIAANRAKAKAEMRERALRSQDGSIHLCNVHFRRDPKSRTGAFSLVQDPQNRGKMVAGRIPTNDVFGSAHIPDTENPGHFVEVPVQPHIFVTGAGLPFPYVFEDGGVWYDLTLLCAIITPHKEGVRLRAVPLAWASEGAASLFNLALAEYAPAREGNIGEIESLPHSLRDSRLVHFFAPFVNTVEVPFWHKPQIAQKALVLMLEGKTVPRKLKPNFQLLGHVHGHPLRLTQTSGRPVAGPGGAFPVCVWEISPGEGSDELRYLGVVGQVAGEVVNYRREQVDGFAALDLDPNRTSPGSSVRARAARLLATAASDPANPITRHAMALGRVDLSWSQEQIRDGLEALARDAIENVNRSLITTRDLILVALTIRALVAERPAIENVLPEVTKEGLTTAVKQRDGECALAVWIASSLGQDSFNWSQPILTAVRRALLLRLALEQHGLKLDEPKGRGRGRGHGKPEAKKAKKARKSPEPKVDATPEQLVRRAELETMREAAPEKRLEHALWMELLALRRLNDLTAEIPVVLVSVPEGETSEGEPASASSDASTNGVDWKKVTVPTLKGLAERHGLTVEKPRRKPQYVAAVQGSESAYAEVRAAQA